METVSSGAGFAWFQFVRATVNKTVGMCKRFYRQQRSDLGEEFDVCEWLSNKLCCSRASNPGALFVLQE